MNVSKRSGFRMGLPVTSALALFGLAGSAQAATTIGDTFPPTANFNGAGTVLQVASPAENSYAVPRDGVITSWSYEAAAAPPAMKLKIYRAVGGNNYLTVGGSDAVTPPANAVSHFPVRIAVKAGDLLGAHYSNTSPFGRIAPAAYAIAEVLGPGKDFAAGSTNLFSGPAPQLKMDLAAQLEPDADGDGFGDESQDGCPRDATVQGSCTPPETTIAVAPAAKVKKPKLTFGFHSSEPNSTFQCKLVGKALDPAVQQFSPCTSPRTYSNLKNGTFTFSVFATDASGTPDSTPATHTVKVKRKKKMK